MADHLARQKSLNLGNLVTRVTQRTPASPFLAKLEISPEHDQPRQNLSLNLALRTASRISVIAQMRS